ncbi:hypothetical protein Hdeb2414_s0005g00183121 [Helianthus debilis subsp. tardiflorus]
MKVPVTSTMFTNLYCKLSKCVCVFSDRMLSTHYLSMCAFIYPTYTAWVYIYPAQVTLSVGSNRWSKDHLSIAKLSKDQQGPRRMFFRGSSIETYLSRRSKDLYHPSISHPSRQALYNYNSQIGQVKPGGRLTWSTYRTDKDIVYIVTEYRQSTDTSAPTNSPLAVALSRTSMGFDLRVFKTLMSFQVFIVGGSLKSSRLESRKCINKLPVSCRQCVDKLPLIISSPLSYARNELYYYEVRSLWY